LQQFLRIIQPVLKLPFAPAQSLRGQRGNNLVPGIRGVFAHKAHFIDLDPGVALERRAQLVNQGFCAAGSAAGGKSAYKSGQTGLRASGRKMNAGDSGVREHSREAFFRGRGFQRYTVNMQLRPRGAQQQAGLPGNLQRRAQFVPGGFELRGSARMPELVQPGKLQQNVEAVDKAARHRGLGFASHARGARQETLPLVPLITYLGVAALTSTQANHCRLVATGMFTSLVILINEFINL
jgi:hypothetical protein